MNRRLAVKSVRIVGLGTQLVASVTSFFHLSLPPQPSGSGRTPTLSLFGVVLPPLRLPPLAVPYKVVFGLFDLVANGFVCSTVFV